MIGARVRVAGTDLAAGWDGSTAAAVTGLEIRWGRDSAFDETEPDQATFYVADPSGEWLGPTKRNGESVELFQVNPARRVFYGSIATTDMRLMKVMHPVTRQPEPVWFVKCTAAGRLGALSESVFPGEMGQESREGEGGWGEKDLAARPALYMQRGMSSIIDGIGQPPPSPSNVVRRMSQIPASEKANSLDLIARLYRAAPLGHVVYDPDTNQVTCGVPATAGTVALNYVGGVTSITVVGDSAVTVPATKVGLPGDDSAQTTTAEMIDAVQVGYSWYGKDPSLSPGAQKRTIYVDSIIQRSTPHAGSGTHRVLEVDAQLMFLQPSEFVAGSVDDYNRAPAWLAGETVKVIASLNGQVRMPVVRFDEARLPFSGIETFLRPVEDGRAVYFAGSMFNRLAGAGPQFQIVGGVLRFDTTRQSWLHDVNLAPAAGNLTASLTLAGVFGSTSNATLGSFDEQVRLADLSTVTKGL